MPLVEIVSRPDIRHPDQARAYVTELRAILVAIGASDAKMEEGSMRVDANVSVRRPGDDFNTRCEIKNVNSVRSLGRAIEYEAKRQIALHEAGEPVVQQTRHWDENDGKTHTLRSKEDADDYRYFLEPDLVVVDPGPEWIERVRAALPLLPAARRRALAEATGQAANSESVMFVVERDQDDYVVERRPRRWRHRARAETCEGVARDVDGGSAGRLAVLTTMESGGAITATQAKTVLDAMIAGEHERDPEAIAAALGFEAMDTSELEAMVDAAIADQPEAWAKFCAGEGKAMGALVGAVMKASKGQADGKAVTALLNQKKG